MDSFTSRDAVLVIEDDVVSQEFLYHIEYNSLFIMQSYTV